jgi:hypothetical protein
MKEKYVLLNEEEIMLIMSEISELEHDLNEIMNKKKWVLGNKKDCSIRFDSSFLSSATDATIKECFNLSDIKTFQN